jgi:hypothetical protein
MPAVEASWSRLSDGRIKMLVSKEGADHLVKIMGFPSSAEALLYSYDKNKILLELNPRPIKEEVEEKE